MFALGLACMIATPCSASLPTFDINGPAGSATFGRAVYVLRNGNIVVSDPNYSSASASAIGAVHLYGPTGARIASLTGSTPNDRIGENGVLVLEDGNFVVLSAAWNDRRGAATWVSGTAGLQGVVSAANSLVGNVPGDYVGLNGYALKAGAYVVGSPLWDAGATVDAGALTYARPRGVAGTVSAANSLVGSKSKDSVGFAAVLASGAYVAVAPLAANGAVSQAGAVVWCDAAASGCKGQLDAASNALRGSEAGDLVGSAGVTDLGNGNYVVASPQWNLSGKTKVGAVTFRTPTSPAAAVDAGNSLVGTLAGDQIGSGGVTVLASAHYVVSSPLRALDASRPEAGAATWGSGLAGVVGEVSMSNSLIGGNYRDHVGERVVALNNGNYVVASPDWRWNNGAGAIPVGAATWAKGDGSTSGFVATSNSISGGTIGDRVGENVIALPSGDYLVGSPCWSYVSFAGTLSSAGAVTWGDGLAGTVGKVLPGNSLVADTADAQLGAALYALDSGAGVAVAPNWSAPTTGADPVRNAGALAVLSGSLAARGILSKDSAIYGALPNTRAATGGVVPVGEDAFFVGSPSYWTSNSEFGPFNLGAISFRPAGGPDSGPLGSLYTLAGPYGEDRFGYRLSRVARHAALAYSPYAGVAGGGGAERGLVSVLYGDRPNPVTADVPDFSVAGGKDKQGQNLKPIYDASRDRLIVGRPAENKVTVRLGDTIYLDSFDPRDL